MGKLALPGGFAREQEPIEKTAARELEEETGVAGLPMTLVGVFSGPGRDPRGWVVSAAYASVVDEVELPLRAGDDAANAWWYTLGKNGECLTLSREGVCVTMEQLAFDHADILRRAIAAMDIRL
jgi:8-oxo-dGTP diphosphatase